MTYIDNEEFEVLAKDILEDNRFQLLKKDRHHGTNKYDHCKRVGYVSYKLAKFFNCDYKKVVRPALLHDFFYGERTEKPENDYLAHPLTSAINAKECFNVTKEEQDIIKTHMFHFACIKKLCPFINGFKNKVSLKENKPKSKEAWIVCASDLIVSIEEFRKYRFNYSVAVLMMFFINFISVNK